VRVYHLLNGLVEFLSRRSSVLILSPYARNIGNCAEEIYYGLLAARRRGKRVVLLFPQPLFWKFKIELANQELFLLESEHCCLNDGVWCRLEGVLLTVVFVILWRGYAMVRRILRVLHGVWPAVPFPWRNNIFYLIPSIGRSSLWQPEAVREFSWEVVKRCNWKEQYDHYLPVRLQDEKRRAAEKLRVAMGVPLDRWFVCLHVREGGFRNDGDLGANRNCSILNYLDGIRVITEAGGYIVRLGDPSMIPLPRIARVIDYPHTAFKSELMDLYLISECRFYLGVNSGPLDIAWLFQKPVLLTNLTEWTMSFPKRKGDLAIIKHIFSRSRNRFLSLREILEEPFECQSIRDAGGDYVMVENTPDEIRDVIFEHLTEPPNRPQSPLQEAFNAARRAQVHRLLDGPIEFFSLNRRDDAVERYRFASRADSVKGALGRKFVQENWLESSRNRGKRLQAGRVSRAPWRVESGA